MQVTLPEMGESVTEGTIAKWLKQPGDQVREGEGLVEVTTDKVDAEVPAPASGTLVKILAEAGKTVAVGAALAEIAVGADGDGASKKAATASTKPETTPTVPSPASEGVKTTTGAAPNGGHAASKVEVTEGAERLRRWSSTWRKVSRSQRQRASARCAWTFSISVGASSLRACRRQGARRRSPTRTWSPSRSHAQSRMCPRWRSPSIVSTATRREWHAACTSDSRSTYSARMAAACCWSR